MEHNHDQAVHDQWEWNRGPLGRLVKIAYISLRREVEAMLRPLGLTHTQWSTLGILYHFPGLTNADLETILHIERPSVTSLINGMERKGWVTRKANPKDARSKLIYLTENGKALAESTMHFGRLVDQKVLRGFTEEEKLLLRKLLEKLIRETGAEP